MDNNEKEELNSLTIRGDLYQMAEQTRALIHIGIRLKASNVYRIIHKDDVVRALGYIWLYRVEGWWHYDKEYVKYNICTSEDFKRRLHSA